VVTTTESNQTERSEPRVVQIRLQSERSKEKKKKRVKWSEDVKDSRKNQKTSKSKVTQNVIILLLLYTYLPSPLGRTLF